MEYGDLWEFIGISGIYRYGYGDGNGVEDVWFCVR